MASKSHCSPYSNKCRWCRSEALDDMCFSKSEAWRLPSQFELEFEFLRCEFDRLDMDMMNFKGNYTSL
ncbi:hypothetical protein ACSBR1_008808 [Camellia fascicularis]